jgi:hypothetical protein
VTSGAPFQGRLLSEEHLTAENQTEKLVVFTATPGTEDAERLALLRVIGTERFTTLAEVDATAGGD